MQLLEVTKKFDVDSVLRALKIFYDDYSRKLNDIEKTIFDDVTKARSGLMNANTVKDIEEANNNLSGTLKTLFAVAENYPDLKANENFKELQKQLAETEDKIAYSRQFYNDTVYKYNNKCQTFPSNLFANAFGFKEADFFEVAGEARTVPKVEF